MSLEAIVGIIAASERLSVIADMVSVVTRQVEKTMAYDPDLLPELQAILDRSNELLDHVLSAQDVLKAKIANLRDEVGS